MNSGNCTMQIFVALAVFVTFSTAAEIFRGRPELDHHWENFKNKHNKTYQHPTNETIRRKIWESNYDVVNQHNNEAASGKHGFTIELNHLADLTPEEKAQLLGRKTQNHRFGEPFEIDVSRFERVVLPASVDLRVNACMPAVKNQGNCGSCWAFGSTTPTEFATCLKSKGAKILLSEQQIVDCDKNNGGCDGGDERYAWVYVKSAPGQASSSAYPYTSGKTGKAGTCTYVKTKAAATVKGYVGYLPKTNLTAIQALLANQGPLTAAMQVINSFYLVKSGVYSDSKCPSDGTTANHVVVLAGYGTVNGTNYWIVRNSWSTSWATGGYVLMKRGVNMCNIESMVSYPLV